MTWVSLEKQKGCGQGASGIAHVLKCISLVSSECAVVSFFSSFKNFQSSSILIFLCLIFMKIVCRKGKSKIELIFKAKD